MNDRPWRHFISLYLTTPITESASSLVASLEKAFGDSGLPGPYSTETNPDGEKGAPLVKVETKDGESGVWIGNRLVFMPVGIDTTPEKLFAAIRTTSLGQLSAATYSLSSSKITRVDQEDAEKSKDAEVKSLLADPAAQEFSKNFTKKISDTLIAKDVITISKSKVDGLLIDISIRIETPETVNGHTVSDLFSRVEANLIILKAHEDEVTKQVKRIFE